MSQATEAAKSQDGTPPGGPAVAPDLLYTEQESDLRGAVRALLEDRAGWRDVLARTETADTCDTGLWQTLAAQVGCAGLLVPEDQGGAGASYREAAVVAEELGRHAAPVPFLGSAVIATTALLSAGDDELLGQVASGEVTAALAVPFAAGAAGPQENLLPAPTVRLGGPGARRRAGHPPADRHGDRGGRRAHGRRAAGPGRRGALRPVRGAGRRCGPEQGPGGVPGHDPAAV